MKNNPEYSSFRFKVIIFRPQPYLFKLLLDITYLQNLLIEIQGPEFRPKGGGGSLNIVLFKMRNHMNVF